MLRRRPAPVDPDLFAASPEARLRALRSLQPKERDQLRRAFAGWPPFSPGALNAWLLLVTTKPPQWADDLVPFPEEPMSSGEPHPGFLYPDPIGFWAEVRRWCLAIVHTRVQRWETTEAVSVSAQVHLGDEPARLASALELLHPRVVLFLDEPAWQASRFTPYAVEQHHVPDPHRDGQVYQGFWGRLPTDAVVGDVIVGKAPQHPTMHRLYSWPDMAHFLDSCPSD